MALRLKGAIAQRQDVLQIAQVFFLLRDLHDRQDLVYFSLVLMLMSFIIVSTSEDFVIFVEIALILP